MLPASERQADSCFCDPMTAREPMNTFEGRQLLELPVAAQAEARGALPLVLFDGCLGAGLLPLQQLSGRRDAVVRLPVCALLRKVKWGKSHIR